jgi:hypothetical protein
MAWLTRQCLLGIVPGSAKEKAETGRLSEIQEIEAASQATGRQDYPL